MIAPAPETVGDAAVQLRRQLKGAGVENPSGEADLLLAWALGWERAHVHARPEAPLPDEAAGRLAGAAERRARREPMAYILGEREFWSLPFSVNADVLIPRPETELLVERAIAHLKDRGPVRVLDLCTGSGAVGIALAAALPGAFAALADICPRALEVARGNAAKNGVAGRTEIHRGDLFENLPAGAPYDAIVSNPPYICSGEVDALMPEVSAFEPRAALDGGPDGLKYLRRIVQEAAPYLKEGGALLLEMDPGQTSWCVAEVRATGGFREPAIHKDLAGRPRVLEAVRG